MGEQLRNLRGSVVRRKCPEMSVFGETVNHHQNAGVSLGVWQADYEIHSQIFLYMLRNLWWLKKTTGSRGRIFHYLTNDTRCHICLHLTLHAFPKKNRTEPQICPLHSCMSAHGGIMELLE